MANLGALVNLFNNDVYLNLKGKLILMDTINSNPVEEEQDVPLGVAVQQALEKFFKKLGGHQIQDLYKIVHEETEEALLKFVMKHPSIRRNQTKAATLLNLSRTTLRKKLKKYDLL